MNQKISVCNFEIPVEFLPLYKEISKEFEATVRDAMRPNKKKDIEDKLVKSETRNAMMAMLNEF